MTKIDLSEYDLDEEEAEQALERTQKRKKRKSNLSRKSRDSSADDGGSIWLWIMLGIAAMLLYGSDASGILF